MERWVHRRNEDSSRPPNPMASSLDRQNPATQFGFQAPPGKVLHELEARPTFELDANDKALARAFERSLPSFWD